MRKFLESWGGAGAFAAAIAGGAWWIASSIGEVRTELYQVRDELKEDIAALDSRMSGIEAKLDLLIEGLDIQVHPKTGDDS